MGRGESEARPVRVLVIAPHPDDEVLGVGGTIHRLSTEGHEVTVSIVTKGWEPLFTNSQVQQVRREAEAANRVLGVKTLHFMDLPAAQLNTIPEHELNLAFDQLMMEVTPEVVFLPFPGDRHEDHRQVFDACQVALRPVAGGAGAERIMCYETVSETHWAVPPMEPTFGPQLFVDVTDHLTAKREAMLQYASQVQLPPQARSFEAVAALATWRGSVMGMEAAEAFAVVRERWRTGSRAPLG